MDMRKRYELRTIRSGERQPRVLADGTIVEAANPYIKRPNPNDIQAETARALHGALGDPSPEDITLVARALRGTTQHRKHPRR